MACGKCIYLTKRFAPGNLFFQPSGCRCGSSAAIHPSAGIYIICQPLLPKPFYKPSWNHDRATLCLCLSFSACSRLPSQLLRKPPAPILGNLAPFAWPNVWPNWSSTWMKPKFLTSPRAGRISSHKSFRARPRITPSVLNWAGPFLNSVAIRKPSITLPIICSPAP